MRIQSQYSCGTQAAVKLLQKQVKGLTGKKAQAIVQALQLNEPVASQLTGADLLLHAKRVRRLSGRSYVDHKDYDGKFPAIRLYEELPLRINGIRINGKQAMSYFRRLLKGDIPIFSKERYYQFNFTSMHDPNPICYRSNDKWKFTDFGDKLIKLIKKDKAPKIAKK